MKPRVKSCRIFAGSATLSLVSIWSQRSHQCRSGCWKDSGNQMETLKENLVATVSNR